MNDKPSRSPSASKAEGGGGRPRVARPQENRCIPVDRSARPPWLRVRLPATPELELVRRTLAEQELDTVCYAAACPNLGECWSRGTATFMIAGSRCTRRCGFCDVITARPDDLDPTEPDRVARAVSELGLRFAVITCVARDDLGDGGAGQMAATIRAIRARCPGTGIEVLISDYRGDEAALGAVLDASPQVLGHNVETVERLQRRARPAAGYQRSLSVLRRSAELRPDIPTKSGLMLGLGEREEEIEATLRDLRQAGVTLLTLGQYLRPSADHLPVERYPSPREFEGWEKRALALGFRGVAAGPLVRSSYHAEKLAGRLA
jgi:lipoic acid synthetase